MGKVQCPQKNTNRHFLLLRDCFYPTKAIKKKIILE